MGDLRTMKVINRIDGAATVYVKWWFHWDSAIFDQAGTVRPLLLDQSYNR